ncbi:MAG TPA: isoleucine--tRNA ligase [Dissulfurispiraceae bacterium]|nr:isoleucine--tRNA ligase [Dissulfurispiraceae bacterium]
MSIDYKNTLHLPLTDFPMKANLSRREPEILLYWEEQRIYEKMQEANRGKKTYILHDGPPYANGNIHIGHALNKILKDIIVKYKAMQGYYAPYVPGWDCHGLPIELQVDKNLGDKKESFDVLKKRQLCREYAEKYVGIQSEEFRRLGVFGDWFNPYLTLSNSYEASIVREFFRFVRRGSVYKGKKPVHWCPSCVTALAEAEVEYNDKESPSVFVAFPVAAADAVRLVPQGAGKQVAIVIWTTTPWTLPANLALAVHPELVYAAVAQGDRILIVAEDNLPMLAGRIGFTGEVLVRVAGRELEGTKAQHPFIDRESRVIAGEFVTTGEGSGIVHIAPGHGEDDYDAGLRHGLEIYAPVNDHGKFTKEVPEFAGQFVFKANEGIIALLREKNALLGTDKIQHSYPHCWRCKKPVIFRATAQWFISMEKNDLRRKCLNGIQQTTWIPAWGRERINNMVVNRPDWCISRQRSWGVPITLITCEDCGTFIQDDALFDRITDMTATGGSDTWFAMDVHELLGKPCQCAKCGGSTFKKEMDILDVWFDSGVSHAAVVEQDDRLSWPADLYLEGSDQHRGWFQSSLLASVGTRDQAPYRAVLTHGFTVDGQGKKMSKSLGNVIAPQEIIKQNGAEIIRLWVSAEDYKDDIKLSKEIVSRLIEAYRKIRNTMRYLHGNIADFDYCDYRADLLEIDRWMLSKFNGLIKRVTSAYERFDFHEVFHAVYNFCVVEVSSFYLDILKDRVYTFRRDSRERRAAQWVLHRILVDMTRLVAPVLSFTAEEVWSYIAKNSPDSPESVFLAGFPVADEACIDVDLEARWAKLIAIRDEANKALELKKKEKFVGSGLETKLVFSAPNEYVELLAQYRDFLPTLFIVSAAETAPSGADLPEAYISDSIPGLAIKVEKAVGQKCERCWNWSFSVGSFEAHPQLCNRCHGVVAAE